MNYCLQCNDRYCRSTTLNLPIREDRIVYLACDSELLKKSYVPRLAMAVSGLGYSRRAIPNWMCDVIYSFQGEIRWRNGQTFILGADDIDLAFNDDGSFRWMSDFLNQAKKPPTYRPQKRTLNRTRLIDLCMRIDRPDLARHLGR